MKKRLFASICLLLAISILLCACGTQVYTVDVTGLTNLTSNGDISIQEGQSYSGKLTPAQYHELPEAITVTIGGTPLVSGYTYDQETGSFHIDAASITGNIAISAVAHESIVGTWKTTLDITDHLDQEMMSIGPEIATYYNFSDLTIDMFFTFNDDMTCTYEVDKASVTAMVESLNKSLRDGAYAMLNDVLKAQGVTISLEEYLAITGTSFDELSEELFGELNADELFDEISGSGGYQIRDGHLYLGDTGTEKATEYEIVDGTLTLSPVETKNMDEAFRSLLPLVFTRVK
jgi:hypothetical protein